MNNVAVIPARSGSKGMKDKNIRLCHGKPLMAYTIEAALESGMFSCVHVSTDSPQYAEIARQYGAEVPFLRSRRLSSDAATSWDTVLEVLGNYKKRGKKFDTFALLQPTSPLRRANNIAEAYKMYYEKKATSLVSVCEMEHSALWSNKLPPDFSLEGFMSKDAQVRRQELPIYYRINGAIYISDIPIFLENQNLYHDRGFAYVMSKKQSIDIDDEVDFRLAEILMEEV